MREEMEPNGRAWSVRAVTNRDLPALKVVIDATGLFPPAMLDDMIAGYLCGNASAEIWVTTDGDHGPTTFGYCAPERMTHGLGPCC